MQTIHFKNLFVDRTWWTLVPDYGHTFISSGYGTLSPSTRDYVGAAASDSLGMVYCPTSATIAADLSRFSGPLTARWYDPTDGTFKSIDGSPIANAGAHAFTPPGKNAAEGTDWVLVLESAGRSRVR